MPENLLRCSLALAVLVSGMVLPTVARSEKTGINVSVERQCEVTLGDFQPPGTTSIVVNGTAFELNVIGKNETDDFFFDVYNTGNRNASITVNLTVTNETEPWDEGEDLGNFINLTKQEKFQDEDYDPFTLETTYFVPEGEDPINDTYHLVTKLFQSDYPTGHYTGRLRINYSCPNIDHDKNLSGDQNFLIVESKIFKPAINRTGNQSTNVTLPADVNRTGDFETNQTIPQDVNRTGEEGETIQGSNPSQPGVTPQPVPEPEPEPEPEPDPRLIIDIEPRENVYPANRTQFAPVELNVTNMGDEPIEDLAVSPLIADIRDGWQVRAASIANLSTGESVQREVFVRPPADAEPGRYVSPVVATTSDGERTDIDFFSIDVRRLPDEVRTGIVIQESPRSVGLTVNDSQEIPLLIQNTGDGKLTNVTARLQNFEDCGSYSAGTVSEIPVNGSSSLSLRVTPADNTGECNSTVIVSSDQGAYSFSNVGFSVTPEEGLIPREKRVPFLAIVWTMVLGGYGILKKRYDLESVTVKAPFIMLMMGETLIILYLAVNYYSLVSAPFLPF